MSAYKGTPAATVQSIYELSVTNLAHDIKDT